MRYVTGVVILIAASMACSRGNDRAVAALPTSPTRPLLKLPSRMSAVSQVRWTCCFRAAMNRSCFATALETKYATSLGRARRRRVRRSRRRSGVDAGIHPLSRQRLRSRDGDGPRDDADRWRRRRRHLRRAAGRSDPVPAAQRHARRAPRARNQVSADGTRPQPPRPSTRKAAPSGSRNTCAIAPTRAITLTAESKVFCADRRRSGAGDVLRAVHLRAQPRAASTRRRRQQSVL